jgi:hypothetical protein
MTVAVVFTATGAGSWTVPPGVLSIQAEAIGCSATSGGGSGSSGGNGGGAYAITNALAVTPGQTVYYYVGNNGDILPTWLNISTNAAPTSSVNGVSADYGRVAGSGTPGPGGLASSCIGNTKFSGGTGGASAGAGYIYGGGGGGSAGPDGAGQTGGGDDNTLSGGGGGGSDGLSSTPGQVGQPAAGGYGGQGPAGSGSGAGATASVAAVAGTDGGGGGGAFHLTNTTGANGGTHTITPWGSGFGPGGGGGGGVNAAGGSGGTYGGGPGASQSTILGSQGILVVTYTPPPGLIAGDMANDIAIQQVRMVGY